MEDNDQLHSSTALLSRKRAHVTHLIGILVGPDTGLDFCREQSHSGRDLNHDFLVVQPVGQLLHVLGWSDSVCSCDLSESVFGRRSLLFRLL